MHLTIKNTIPEKKWTVTIDGTDSRCEILKHEKHENYYSVHRVDGFSGCVGLKSLNDAIREALDLL